jgi:hypothetical protein
MLQRKKIILWSACIVVLVFSLVPSSFAQEIQTPSEKTGFKEYSSYEDMLIYLKQLQATTTEMLLSSFGQTIEGREQPYAVFSRPLVTQPWEAMTSGKPIVVLAANIHGGERTVRESLLLIAREFATRGTPMNKLLDQLIIVMVPTINPDGLVRATRGNSQGVDVNRDWIKLEQPELYNYVRNILLTWNPHVFLDGHNGCAQPYNICYQGPANAASDQRITDLCDQEIFPFITREMEKNGHKAWYYSGGDEKQWRTAPTEARISINYGGMINSFAVLFESPSQDRDIGAKSGLVATRALVQYVADNAQKVMSIVNQARRETMEKGQNASGDIVVQMTKGPKPYKVSYEIMTTVGGTTDPQTGRITGGTREIKKITNAELMMEPVPTKTRPWPYAYILEARAYKAVELLRAQKVLVEVLTEDTELPVESYRLAELTRSSQYDHPASASAIKVEDETVKEKRTFPKGTYIIRAGQAMGRVITHVLEPETPDNVITWNKMDALIPGGRGGGRGAEGEMPPGAEAQQAGRGAGRGTGGEPPAGAAAQQAAQGGRGRGAQVQGQPPAQPAAQQPRANPVIPIFKLMTPTNMPTGIVN